MRESESGKRQKRERESRDRERETDIDRERRREKYRAKPIVAWGQRKHKTPFQSYVVFINTVPNLSGLIDSVRLQRGVPPGKSL